MPDIEKEYDTCDSCKQMEDALKQREESLLIMAERDCDICGMILCTGCNWGVYGWVHCKSCFHELREFRRLMRLTKIK